MGNDTQLNSNHQQHLNRGHCDFMVSALKPEAIRVLHEPGQLMLKPHPFIATLSILAWWLG